jgi:lipopolysaccharide/colanic/teichoic acid biosynthesis glycosyltransferase
MSFIGPRPERPIFTDVYNKKIIGYSRRKNIRPGITGLAQISCGYNALPEEKLQFDLLYLKYKNSFMLNGLITLYTIKKMFFWKTFKEVSYRGNR